MHREKEELQYTSFIHDLQIHMEELKNEIDELKESNECKQMQLDIMNVSKCNLCEETGKIKQDKLLLISMYEKIFKENYHLRKKLLQNKPDPKEHTEIAVEDLYKCKDCSFKCMDKFLFRNHTNREHNRNGPY